MSYTAAEDGTHDELLAAAARTRRARDTHSELLPEFTGLTAGEALARLTQEEPQAAPQKTAALPRRKMPQSPPPVPKPVPTTQPLTQKPSAGSPTQTKETEEKPHFEVRV